MYWRCCVICKLCLRNPCHPRCPNYEAPKATHYCSSCGEGILDGEEYIENIDGEYRHYDCFNSTIELVKWLGCETKIMEEAID